MLVVAWTLECVLRVGTVGPMQAGDARLEQGRLEDVTLFRFTISIVRTQLSSAKYAMNHLSVP